MKYFKFPFDAIGEEKIVVKKNGEAIAILTKSQIIHTSDHAFSIDEIKELINMAESFDSIYETLKYE